MDLIHNVAKEGGKGGDSHQFNKVMCILGSDGQIASWQATCSENTKFKCRTFSLLALFLSELMCEASSFCHSGCPRRSAILARKEPNKL